MSTTKLAIVLPCYNEEDIIFDSAKQLTILVERMVSDKLIHEDSFLVFVNDGSNDRTWDIINELCHKNKNIHGINLAKNVGHQNAIMAGMMTFKDSIDAIITIDVDLQDDIECIPKMIKEMQAGNEIVYAVKTSRQADHILKRISAQAFYKLQTSMGVKSIYNHADFRLLSRKALDILEQYHERNLYLRGLIPQIGLQSSTIEEVISQRKAGQSKYTLGKMVNLALDGITSFSVKPLYSIIYLGLIFLIISIVFILYVLYVYLNNQTVAGWASIVISIWMVGGFILISIGTACIYIGKIYNEVKQRPLYHIIDLL